MTNDKKGSAKRETKGGMLGKNNDSEARSEREEEETANKPQSAPKISKENAEGRHDDKPVH